MIFRKSRRIEMLEIQLDGLRSDMRYCREDYWRLRNDYEALLSHLGLEQRMMPSVIKTSNKRQQDGTA